MYCPEGVLSEFGEAFAESRKLGYDVVGSRRQHRRLVFAGGFRKQVERGYRLCAHYFQRFVNLQLFHAFGEVAAGHSLVDMLVARKLAKFLDSRLDVVPRDFLALVDFVDADICFDPFVGVDSLLRNVETEFLLRFHDRNPQIAFE